MCYIGFCAISMYTMMIVCGWRIWKAMHENMRWSEASVKITKLGTHNVEKWASGNGRSTVVDSGDDGGSGNVARSSSMRQLANTLILQVSVFPRKQSAQMFIFFFSLTPQIPPNYT